MTNDWLTAGLDIGEINARRRELSLIKGGKLLEQFRGVGIRVFAISDVRGDDIAVIGSGIGDTRLVSCEANVDIVASNRDARDSAASFAIEQGLSVIQNDESLYGDVEVVCSRIAADLIGGEAGVYIWGGEPVVQLPEVRGKGGRMQCLALMLAQQVRGRDIHVLAAGTDGIDGDSDFAGAFVDGETVDDPAAAVEAVASADSATWLASRNAEFVSGPTGTNVMDLVVAIVGNGGRA